MKRLQKMFLVAAMCCVSSIASAYNPALEDESRWVFYDSDKEGADSVYSRYENERNVFQEV